MKRALLLSILSSLACLPALAEPAAAAARSEIPVFDIIAAAAHEESCEAHTGEPAPFSAIGLTARSLNETHVKRLAKRLPQGARLAGGWELNSDDPNFGGLSGLAVTDGQLLAITDSGGWVAIDLSEGGAPVSAAIAYMKGDDGYFLQGKDENDAEGLAWRDGIALVSFERDFRIEAFDLGQCGAAARAVWVADLPAEHGGRKIDGNSGPEALALTPEGALLFGYEGASGSVSPIGEVPPGETSRWTGRRANNPKGFALVGMDVVRLPSGEDREISLFRAYDPFRGARSVLVWGPGEDDRLTLSRPVLTDNFEGLAAQVLDNGQLRLWIVSDNNFTKLQRTLLYAFDVTP